MSGEEYDTMSLKRCVKFQLQWNLFEEKLHNLTSLFNEEQNLFLAYQKKHCKQMCLTVEQLDCVLQYLFDTGKRILSLS